MKFDDDPPLWRDLWKPVPVSDRLELFLVLAVVFFPAVLVLKYLFS